MKKVMLLAPKDLCDTLQHALETRYITLPCYDSSTGKELLRYCPDILILSLFLPGTDGLTFLKENIGELPSGILVLTSLIDTRILDELSNLDVDAVFLLPAGLNCIRRHLDSLCTKKYPS